MKARACGAWTGREAYPTSPFGAESYFRAVTVISMWAFGDASLVTPTVVRAGRGGGNTLP